MTSWIVQHFLNPAFFWPGMALLAVPIIIHLINRMRYRRVRFAAMDFLLASQKRNRRRVLIEQLLLLLLRLLLVLLVVLLLGRLILDPEQLSLFQGAQAHHVVVLDDSASMRDKAGSETAFETAKEIVRRIAAEGSRRPGTQKLTLILMSAPDKTVAGLSERSVDEPLLTEVTERLESLRCTHQALDPADAIEAARLRLADQQTGVKTIHVLSDFREANWLDNQEAVSLLSEMSDAGVGLNLVRCVGQAHENLSLTELGGAVEVAAAGVPVSLSATVRNWGSREVRNVSAAVFIDGQRLPRTVEFQTIAAGDQAQRRFDVIFDSPRPHTVMLTLDDDPLEVDNRRWLAVDVPVENPVLIVDGSPSAEQAAYIADALAADQSITGFAPEIRSPEDLRRIPLTKYSLIYLINVPELAPDAVAALDHYVQDGGGLAWYMGDAVRPAFYNEELFRPEESLFPVVLGLAPLELENPEQPESQPKIQVTDDPLFSLFTRSPVPILDQVLVNRMYPVADQSEAPSIARDVTVLATLAGRPLMLEQRHGKGRIFTCLTSAGPLTSSDGVVWTNWANGPAGFSFVVLQLELAKRLVRRDRAFPLLPTGTPLELEFSPALFLPDVDVQTPLDQVTRLQASTIGGEEGDAPPQEASLHVQYVDTDEPGVYTLTLTGQDQEQQQRLFALNVPPEEGALALISDDDLRSELGNDPDLQIQPAGSFEWIRSESPGSEVRWFLLVLLALICLAEQFLASRLSYRTDAG